MKQQNSLLSKQVSFNRSKIRRKQLKDANSKIAILDKKSIQEFQDKKNYQEQKELFEIKIANKENIIKETEILCRALESQLKLLEDLKVHLFFNPQSKLEEDGNTKDEYIDGLTKENQSLKKKIEELQGSSESLRKTLQEVQNKAITYLTTLEQTKYKLEVQNQNNPQETTKQMNAAQIQRQQAPSTSIDTTNSEELNIELQTYIVSFLTLIILEHVQVQHLQKQKERCRLEVWTRILSAMHRDKDQDEEQRVSIMQKKHQH